MDILPFPKNLYDRCIAMGVKVVELNFSGGNDQGYTSVSITRDTNLSPAPPPNLIDALERDIEEWAEDQYEYGGAGDGSEYGDDITYDFTHRTATHQSWFMERAYSDLDQDDLSIASDEDEDDDDDSGESPTMTDRLSNSVDPSIISSNDEFATMAQRILDNVNSFINKPEGS